MPIALAAFGQTSRLARRVRFVFVGLFRNGGVVSHASFIGPKRRVLFIDNSSTFGGAIVSLSQLTREVGRFGFEPIVLSAQPEAELDRLFPHCRAHRIELRSHWTHGDACAGVNQTWVLWIGPFRKILRSLYWFFQSEVRDFLTAIRFAVRYKPDVIHLNNTAESQFGFAVAARMLRIPCVSHMREYRARGSRTSSLRLAAPNVHVAISRSVRDSLVEAGVKTDKIALVPDSIDAGEYRPGAPSVGLAYELGIPEGYMVVGLFGRLVPFKGILEFVRCFAKVVESERKVVALIVGDRSDGAEAYVDNVRGLISELGLEPKVIFAGFRPDTPDILRLTDIAVLSSLGNEGFGRTLVEAMATGIPVVGPSYGGPVDVVREGVDGILCDPRDMEGFSSAIIHLLDHPEVRQEMGRNARQRVLEKFSNPAVAEKIVDLYWTVLSGGRSFGATS